MEYYLDSRYYGYMRMGLWAEINFSQRLAEIEVSDEYDWNHRMYCIVKGYDRRESYKRSWCIEKIIL